MTAIPLIPAPPAVTLLAGHVQNFLGQSRFPVRPYAIGYAGPQTDARLQFGFANPGEVSISPSAQSAVSSLAARYGTRGRLNPQQVYGAHLMLHEGLHQTPYGLTTEGATANPWEEGLVDSVARDLLPIFTKRLLGSSIGSARKRETGPNTYEPQVSNIRQLSTFGSGSKKFSDYKARVWRRTALEAAPAARQQMVDAATAVRAAWGKEHGR